MLKHLLFLGFLLAVAGCAYHTPPRSDIDNPLVRSLAWFSYLDGSDIRETCAPGSIERYRLVYNAQYRKQVRAYEATGDGAGGAYLVARARLGSPNLLDLQLADPLAPWRWRKSDVRLDKAAFEEFKALLADSGLGVRPANGKRLHSHDFYWVAAGCRDGAFQFGAWVDAQGDFAAIRFEGFLVTRDKTGLDFREAQPVPYLEKVVTGRRRGQNPPDFFVLTVSDDGLGGLVNAF